uniref:transmembrane protein 47-like n=1 Tax=Myxine glutinosa TaxID=7769 RepID=UPI00358F523B
MPAYEETRTVVGQPWRLAAVLMSSCALFLVFLAVVSPAWVTASSRTKSQSIWEVCWTLEKCVNNLGTDWRVTIVILEFFAGLLCVVAITLAVLALCKVSSIRSFVPGICILLAALLQLIAVIVYPVKFLEVPAHLGIDDGPVYYEFDWGYGVAFGAFFFMVAAGIMFLLKSYCTKRSY